MSKAQEVWYQIEFAITYGEDAPTKVSKQTYHKVCDMLRDASMRNRNDLLHKFGYTNADYEARAELLSKMGELLDSIAA